MKKKKFAENFFRMVILKIHIKSIVTASDSQSYVKKILLALIVKKRIILSVNI